MVGKIFGAKRDTISRERRRLHNSECRALYTSNDVISIDRFVYRVLVENQTGREATPRQRPGPGCGWGGL